MRNRMLILTLALTGLLSLPGCTLARPEADNGDQVLSDRFAGLYLVRRDAYESDLFYENPNLTQLGSAEAETEQLGTLSLPRDVLLAVRDEGGDWTFPGLEGWALFCTETVEDGAPLSASFTDLLDGEYHTTVADSGVRNELKGVLYLVPPEGASELWAYETDELWTAYRVYQTAEGQPYLDGTGDSFSGGMGSYTAEEEQAYTLGEETRSESVRVTVELKTAPRLERVLLRQYDKNGQLLDTAEIPLTGGDAEQAWLEGAAWAVVEETDAGGNTVRTVFDRPGPEEEPAVHTLILPGEDGAGQAMLLSLT